MKGFHPPITPIKSVDKGTTLKDRDWKIYSYIVRHFLATISRDMIYDTTKFVFKFGNGNTVETFTLSGSRIVDPGFKEVMPWVEVHHAKLPELFIEGQKFQPFEIKITERKVWFVIKFLDKSSFSTHRK